MEITSVWIQWGTTMGVETKFYSGIYNVHHYADMRLCKQRECFSDEW